LSRLKIESAEFFSVAMSALIPIGPVFMIHGVGVDLVEKERVERALERFGERFVRRVLTEREWHLCQNKGDSIGSVAARIAAKESVFKAFGTGWARGIGWKDVEVINDSQGKPVVQLYGKASQLAEGYRLHVSISHEKNSAVAFAVMEKQETRNEKQEKDDR
jgi:holo-[acyl-carrier protein] synthase